MSEELKFEGEGAKKAREAREAAELKETQEKEKNESAAPKEAREQMESSFNASRKGIPETTLILVVAFDTLTGQVQVQGPIANKGESYKMLELARDAIKDYNDKRMPGIGPV